MKSLFIPFHAKVHVRTLNKTEFEKSFFIWILHNGQSNTSVMTRFYCFVLYCIDAPYYYAAIGRCNDDMIYLNHTDIMVQIRQRLLKPTTY